ncbi:alpha/beta fold hydrolase [Saccharothrix coeruleofusca]|uniref:Epoxide hydrolase n=1 Tax=Saccharothrix coeruleofusca TaxID=33919 RepID=A0A918APF1_9PSEU|nr:alpha/beta hydrolase [Saccharothrix coeruleofusca]GGP66531.1 epoxide hydrolase [Saccharothrix coeruleofusca]
MRYINANGVNLAFTQSGTGPLVVLLHGFPENHHSWRHQVEAISAAGFQVIAPDLRGFGESGRPERVEDYSVVHYVGDVVALIAAAGADRAVVVGHDWGSVPAWGLAMMRPDLVRGVIGISGPPIPRGPVGMATGSKGVFPDGRRFYLDYFQDQGVADAEFDSDPRATLRGMLHTLSYENPADDVDQRMVVRPGAGMLGTWRDPGRLPGWLSERDFDAFARPYEVHGFTPSLAFYRNLDRNWELTAPFEGVRLTAPAMLVLGERDVVRFMPGVPELVERLPDEHPGFRRTLVVPGAGHWVQQEQPEIVSKTIIEFLEELS